MRLRMQDSKGARLEALRTWSPVWDELVRAPESSTPASHFQEQVEVIKSVFLRVTGVEDRASIAYGIGRERLLLEIAVLRAIASNPVQFELAWLIENEARLTDH